MPLDRNVLIRERAGVALDDHRVPAPIRGWNARDSLDNMHPEDAVRLDNWFPTFGTVSLRKGSKAYASAVSSGDVSMLGEYQVGARHKFVAASGGAFWDITTAGAAVSLKTGFTNNRWQQTDMNGVKMFTNGADHPQKYDGSAVSSLAISGAGLTTTNILGCFSFKNRTYFWEDESQDFWYSALDAAGGACTKFPLSRVGNWGGNLVAMAAWSRDSGDGPDDFAVFIMSSGEIIIYAGTNPGDASAWEIIGNYKAGRPLDVRAVLKLGGDCIIVTKSGYVSLGRLIIEGAVSEKVLLSDRIRDAVAEAIGFYETNTGWEAILYAQGNMAIFNIPVGTAEFEQHVINVHTGAWCRFKDWNARAFGIYKGELYMGLGDGTVVKGDINNDDLGSNIEADGIAAYNDLGKKGVKKTVRSILATLKGTGDLVVSVVLQTDFKDRTIAHGLHTLATAAATNPWEDQAVAWENWDEEWLDAESVSQKIIGARGHGFKHAVRIKAQTKKAIDWLSTKYFFEKGSI